MNQALNADRDPVVSREFETDGGGAFVKAMALMRFAEEMRQAGREARQRKL
jgi:hypothetical protein